MRRVLATTPRNCFRKSAFWADTDAISICDVWVPRVSSGIWHTEGINEQGNGIRRMIRTQGPRAPLAATAHRPEKNSSFVILMDGRLISPASHTWILEAASFTTGGDRGKYLETYLDENLFQIYELNTLRLSVFSQPSYLFAESGNIWIFRCKRNSVDRLRTTDSLGSRSEHHHLSMSDPLMAI